MTDIAPTDHTSLEPAHARGLSMDEVTTLLQQAQAHDKRTIGYLEKRAWASAAAIAGWTYQEASRAIDEHQATNPDYLKAAHITTLIERDRRAAELVGGLGEGGVRIPSLSDAVELWRGGFRTAGAKPSVEQHTQATSLLGQMLLPDAPCPRLLAVAVKAGREGSARIDWTWERVQSGRDELDRHDVLATVPIKYLPNSYLNVDFAIRHRDFPAHWRVYDPFGDRLRPFEKELLIPTLRAMSNTRCVPDYAPCERNLPSWIWQYADDRNTAVIVEETQQQLERRAAVEGWLDDDQEAWEAEQTDVVRQWYLDHPGQLPARPRKVEE